MAKGNMLLGFSRGSVGDLTFYRRNSQQVTRARARVVKNPKTLQQQMQRAIMRTSVEAYKILKSICDHSWEGVAYGANSYAEFQRQNMAMLRRLAAAGGENSKSFLPAGFNGLVAMPWVLSKGSIAWAGAYGVNDSAMMQFDTIFSSASSFDNITYAEFCSRVGLQVGDQLTFIDARVRSDIDEATANEIRVSRIILAPAHDTAEEVSMFQANGRINDPNPLNENANALLFTLEAASTAQSAPKVIKVTLGDDPDEPEWLGLAVIVSRRAADGAWLRSSASLTYAPNAYDGGYTLRQASMVASTEIVAPSDWYLNNANEGGTEE